MKYDLTSLSVKLNIANADECNENGILAHCWRECKLVWPLWKTVQRFLKLLQVELLQQSTSAYINKGNEVSLLKRHLHCHDS
jgi:hypothetical protein